MLKFQAITPEDRKLAASIQRRRQAEEERRLRIFNPRVRKIGVDKEFLDRQVEEKKQLHELEQAKECQLDEDLIRSTQLALFLEKQQEEERHRINKEIDNFRRLYQKPDDRRDFDLYDPNALKKEISPGLKDDAELGLASAQKFEGENAGGKERLKVQREEMRWWIEKQRVEQTQIEKDQQEAEKAYQEAVISRDKRAAVLDRIEKECRRRLNEATANFNRALAEERQHRRRCEAIQDEEDKKAEIYNHVTGDFLTEAREQADSTRGPNKPLASRYKGMNAEQLKAFRDAQAQQIKEIEKMKLEENLMNKDWEQLMNAHARAAYEAQRDLDRKKADVNRKIAEENMQLGQQHRDQQKYLNRHVYRNQPSPDFFEQFNRGTR